MWKDFPATSSPRPLVLAGPSVNDPATGFPSTGDKIAYISGRIALRSALPVSSATWQQQPLVTAAQALADLPSRTHGGPSTATELMITHVRLSTSTFSTDRGQRRLPAWLFTFAHVHDPASVLAIGTANRWPKARPPRATAPRA